MPSSLCRTAIGLLAAPTILIGQSPQDRPTFRAGVQYVEVDVRVTDKDGNPVRGLTRDDFTLLEDDRAQTISTFSFVDLPIEPRASRQAAARTVASDVSTNTGEGRIYVMLVSVLPAADPEAIRRVARRFIDESMGVHDQMAVIPVLDAASKAQGFTTNRALLLAAVNRIERSPAPVPPTWRID